MTKNIGFLSFGHWSPSTRSGTRSAATFGKTGRSWSLSAGSSSG